MGDIRTSANASFRDYAVDGVPASGDHEPIKSNIRTTFGVVEDRIDAVEGVASTGIAWTSQIVRVRATGNVDLATATENGDTLNGVVLATGNHFLAPCQSAGATVTDPVTGFTNSPQNGLYTVPASGAATRATFADSAAELARIGFMVSEGTVGAGERYTLPLDADDITVGTTALNFARIGLEVSVSAEVAAGRGAFAALGDRLDDFDDRIEVEERIASANARGALYGITDPTEAALFGAEGVEMLFLNDFTRNGYETGTAPDDLTGWTFSRALAGTAENASGTLDTFASGVPRITNRGLLVEPARTNLLLYSDDFANAAWTKYQEGTGVTPVVTANAALAPDGTMTADRVELSLGGGTSGSDWSMLFPAVGIPIVNATTYSGRVWVEGTAGEKIAFRHVAGGAVMTHTFSGEWERIGRAETSISTVGNFEIGLRGARPEPVSNAVTFNIWGADLDLSNYPTSHTPTTSAPVVRPADAPALSVNFENGCTVLVEFAYIGGGSLIDAGGRVALALAGDSNADRVLLFNTEDGLRVSGEVVSVNTIEMNAYGEAPAEVVQQIAFRIAPDNNRIARNGELGEFDNVGAPPAALTRLGLGMYPWSAAHGGVVIRKVVIIPLAVSDSQLKVLTGGAALPTNAPRWVQVQPAAAFSARDSARVFRIGGRQYLSNGFGPDPIKDLWTSTDGTTFDLVNGSPPYQNWSTVIALGSVIYAFQTQMWRSLDGGLTWTQIIPTMPFAMETDSPALVVGGKLLAFPGTGLSPDAGNGVWEYDPGANTWTQIYTAAWGPRTIPTACEFDGAIYLYGGFDLTTANVPPEIGYPTRTTLNDLWRSTDGGVTWTQIIADMPFQPRVWPSMVVFEGELYLMAGFDNLSDPATNFTDTYKTANGTTWVRVETAGEYTERHAGAAFVLNGRLFLASGKANREPADGVTNDIWELQAA